MALKLNIHTVCTLKTLKGQWGTFGIFVFLIVCHVYTLLFQKLWLKCFKYWYLEECIGQSFLLRSELYKMGLHWQMKVVFMLPMAKILIVSTLTLRMTQQSVCTMWMAFFDKTFWTWGYVATVATIFHVYKPRYFIPFDFNYTFFDSLTPGFFL